MEEMVDMVDGGGGVGFGFYSLFCVIGQVWL
jgi:hypothetical protein